MQPAVAAPGGREQANKFKNAVLEGITYLLTFSVIQYSGRISIICYWR